jgi:hypothetical protein
MRLAAEMNSIIVNAVLDSVSCSNMLSRISLKQMITASGPLPLSNIFQLCIHKD